MSVPSLRGGKTSPRSAIVLAWLVCGAAPPAQAQSEAQRWSFAATFRESRSDNLFLRTPEDPGDTVDSLGLSLAYGRLTRRSLLALSGWASGSLFRDLSQFSRASLGLGASLSHDLGPRARLNLGEYLSSGFNLQRLYASSFELPDIRLRSSLTVAGLTYRLAPRTKARADLSLSAIGYRGDSTVEGGELLLPLPPEAGGFEPPPPVEPGAGDPLLPEPFDGSSLFLNLLAQEGVRTTALDILSYRAGAGLSHRFSPRTGGSLGLGYRETRFDSDRLVDGRQIEARAALNHRAGPSSTLALGYGFLQNRAHDPRVTTHTLIAELRKALTRRLDASGSLGVSRFTSSLGAPAGNNLVGGAGLVARLRRTSFEVRAGRAVYQAIGFGRNQVTDTASALLGQNLGRRLGLSLFAQYRHSRDTVEDGFALRSQVYGAGLTWRLGRHLTAGATYAFRRLDREPQGTRIDSSFFSLYATYTRVWR